MSPAAEKIATERPGKLGGKEFEETFKPAGREKTAKELEDKNDKKGKKGKKGNKDKTDKTDKKGKKKKTGLKILIIVFAIVVLLAGAAAAIYFSGNLNYVMNLVGLSKPVAATTTLADQQKVLDQKAADLAAREASLNELQKKLDAQQAALSSAEAVPSPSPTFETILAGLSEEKLAEIKKVGTIYSKMDPTAAADAISKIYDTQHIAMVIYYMQPAASALVMAKLDPSLAADVTTMLAS